MRSITAPYWAEITRWGTLLSNERRHDDGLSENDLANAYRQAKGIMEAMMNDAPRLASQGEFKRRLDDLPRGLEDEVADSLENAEDKAIDICRDINEERCRRQPPTSEAILQQNPDVSAEGHKSCAPRVGAMIEWLIGNTEAYRRGDPYDSVDGPRPPRLS